MNGDPQAPLSKDSMAVGSVVMFYGRPTPVEALDEAELSAGKNVGVFLINGNAELLGRARLNWRRSVFYKGRWCVRNCGRVPLRADDRRGHEWQDAHGADDLV